MANGGEGGVVRHSSFRNTAAVQTHPLNRSTPSVLYREVSVPKGKKTKLRLRVSHHPHGDWQLRVLANKKVLRDTIVGPKSVSKDEWMTVEVDLTAFAGRKIRLTIENRPNNWRNEWAYWNRVELVSQ